MVKRKSAPRRKSMTNSQRSDNEVSPKTPKKRKYGTSKVCMNIGNKEFKIFRTTLKQIKRLQASVQSCIPRLPFSRLIREILMEQGLGSHKIQIEALKAIQEAAEIYLTYLFEDANKCAMHCHRVTLMPKDIHLVLDIRGCNDPGYS
ncbi:uncharacterized protein LOC130442832 [Diorhabda sublineata]|uniref:uncharacterized protein LOC130442832 n=1 Tax=Diorhabda sublineata TaxID=1163346 RepID=UPI0024E0ADD0|nr:uncharacterized protein LOC130442832 [Diorhabda sublineata]